MDKRVALAGGEIMPAPNLLQMVAESAPAPGGCQRTFGIFRRSAPCGKTPAADYYVGGSGRIRLCQSCHDDLDGMGYHLESC